MHVEIFRKECKYSPIYVTQYIPVYQNYNYQIHESCRIALNMKWGVNLIHSGWKKHKSSISEKIRYRKAALWAAINSNNDFG